MLWVIRHHDLDHSYIRPVSRDGLIGDCFTVITLPWPYSVKYIAHRVNMGGLGSLITQQHNDRRKLWDEMVREKTLKFHPTPSTTTH